jgi:hypothetical protein
MKKFIVICCCLLSLAVASLGWCDTVKIFNVLGRASGTYSNVEVMEYNPAGMVKFRQGNKIKIIINPAGRIEIERDIEDVRTEGHGG